MRIRTISIVAAALFLGVAGSASAQLVSMPASLTFADTGTGSTSAVQTVTYTNSGNASLTVTGIALTGANPGDFTLSNIMPGPPVSLAPGVSISVDVAFAPTAINNRMALVSASVKNMGNTVDVPVSGKGIGPTASVVPSPIVVGGKPFGQAQPPLTVTISNSGGAQLHITAVTITGPDAARFAMAGLPGLPKTLGPAASFPITITFTPTVAGKANATLTVVSDDPKNPTLATPISGLAGNPQISLDLGTIIFGNERVNQMSQPQDVNITNTGFSDLHVNTITMNGTNAGDFALTNVPNLPATLTIGSSIKFTVGFAPTAAGARAAQVTIGNDDPNALMKALPLSGVGTTPMASVMPAKLDFGQVTVLAMGGSNFTITNTGTGIVKVNTVTITGPDAALFSSKMMAPFNVAPMGSVVVQVAFAPKTIGMFNATLNLTTDDPNLPNFALPMAGEGTSPGLAVSPGSIDFGSINVGDSSMAQTVTLSNTGNQPLIIESFLLDGIDSNDFTIGNEPVANAMIAPNAKITFTVTFKPTGDPRSEDGQIDIMTNDPKTPAATIHFTGTGVQPGLSVSPMPGLTFGTVQVGSKSTAQAVTIQNTGSADLHISTIKVVGAMGGPFSADMQGGLTIASNKAVKVNVVFAPTMMGTSNAALEIDSSDTGISPAQVTLTGTGVSPMVSASPTTIDFGPIPIGQTSAGQTITIRNSGKTAVNLDKITASDPQFGPPATGLNMLVPANSTVMLQVAFTPTMTGDFKTQLQFWLKDQTVPTASVVAQGSGVQAGMMRGGGCSISRARATALVLPAAFLLLLGLGLRRRRAK